MRQQKSSLDRVWRAVIRRSYADGRERVEYLGPFGSSSPAAAAVTRALRSPWHGTVETTGVVESSATSWEPR